MLWHCPVVLNVRKQNITLFYPSLTIISLFASPNLLPLLLKVDQNPSKGPNDQLGIDGSDFRPFIPIYVATGVKEEEFYHHALQFLSLCLRCPGVPLVTHCLLACLLPGLKRLNIILSIGTTLSRTSFSCSSISLTSY